LRAWEELAKNYLRESDYETAYFARKRLNSQVRARQMLI
jgi:hypothetical protein